MGPESFVTRWWNAVRPLPSQQVRDKAVLAQKRKQARLIGYTVVFVAVITASWFVYDYFDRAPERARVEFERGMLLMGPKSYAGAIESFDRAISIWPNHPETHLNRGIALHNLGRNEEALAEF